MVAAALGPALEEVRAEAVRLPAAERPGVAEARSGLLGNICSLRNRSYSFEL